MSKDGLWEGLDLVEMYKVILITITLLDIWTSGQSSNPVTNPNPIGCHHPHPDLWSGAIANCQDEPEKGGGSL